MSVTTERDCNIPEGFEIPLIDAYGEKYPLSDFANIAGVIDLGDGFFLLVQDDSRIPCATNLRGWLLLNNVPIGMIRTLMTTWTTLDGPTVCDVEVRPEFRGQGHSKRLYAAMEQFVGATLYTNGHYTPEGFERLRGKAKQIPSEDAGTRFSSQNFVEDWDNYRPMHW